MANKILFLLASLALLSHLASAGSDGKCRAIVFQGAGDISSYEAGVFKGLVENLASEDVSYDVVGGTGFGVINLISLATHAVGNETGAAEAMESFWSNVDYGKIYKDWPLSILQSIFFEYGLYDTTPYMSLMKDILSHNSAQRMINLVAADANSGRLIRFDESVLNPSLAALWVGASSFPGVFPHVAYNGMTLVDASVMNSLDIGGAITRCRDSGYSDKNIIVDLVMTNSASSSVVNCSTYNSFSMIGRLISVYSYSFAVTDLYHSLANYKDVNFRYSISPDSAPYRNLFPYDFKASDMKTAMTQGYQDAVNAIHGGNESRIKHFEMGEALVEQQRPGRQKPDTSHVYRDYPEPQYTL